MNEKVFLVLGESRTYPNLVVAAYDDPEPAKAHKAFIDAIGNEWSARIEWIPLRNDFDSERGTDGLRDFESLEVYEQLEG